MTAPRVALTGISKRYGPTQANSDIALAIAPGEIHALLGENGAGKSTLVKIIYGVVQPDAGSIAWEGAAVAISNPNAARGLGIGMVFQHFSLFDTLTVAENIALGLASRESIAKLSERIAEVSQRYGLSVTPGRHVHHLSVGERQRVEIVRCLLGEPRLLIMDEPTSVLTPQEVDALFAVLRRLAAEDCSILYISHKLEEIRALCDTATVLRAGRVVGTCVPAATSPAAMAEMMTGAVLPETRRGETRPGAAMLEVAGLSLAADEPFGTHLRDIALSVRAGEIVGVAGVSGNGQKELLAALSGERLAVDAASVRIAGVPVGHARPALRRRMGLSFVPEERLGRGAVGEMSLAENALLTCYQNGLAVRGWIRPEAIRRYAGEVIRRFRVKAEGTQSQARSLSGGNMQKFIIGREVGTGPRLLLAAHPTWGVDIGASLAIRQELLDLAAAGTAILVVSEDLPELFEICDRIAVLFHGMLSAPLPVADLSLEAVGLLMGGHTQPASAMPEPAHAA